MKARKKMCVRIAFSFLFFFLGIFLESTLDKYVIVVYLISYFLVGYNVLVTAVRNILRGQVFDENFLMTVATIGAFCIGEFTEGVAVMIFYQVGELFQSYAVDKSRKSISTLMDIRPDYANVQKGNELVQVDPYDVFVDDVIVIKPGERVPLDCVVLTGNTTIDTSALTGESLPRELSEGDELLSGSVNINGLVTARVTAEYSDSTVNRILDLVENATDKKSRAEHFITKFARYYTPIVVISAAVLAVVPPLVLSESFSEWIYRALAFLVVSCPCALVISIPLSFFGGIGGASKLGILVKGSNYLEVLAKTDTIVFDKTGTLTKGVFNVCEIKAIGITESELLEYATYAENYSNHPISNSLKKEYNKSINQDRINSHEEIAGHGINAVIDNKSILVGNEKLMKQYNITVTERPKSLGTVIYIAVENKYMGYILISDEIKPDSLQAVKTINNIGIKKTVMLTGDSKEIGETIAEKLGISKVYTELLPTDKVEITEKLIESSKGSLVFVGDGINDAPVLARADVGVAMGNIGSDAAIEAADIVIMNDEISKIATAIDISQRTLRIVKQNIVFALGIKIGVLILTALGMSNMWEAVFADVGVSVIAILNACRMLSVKKYEK